MDVNVGYASLISFFLTFLFKACLKSGDCACFQALKVLDSTCESFSTLNDDIKGKKNKCIKGDEKGSFGACRSTLLKSFSYLIHLQYAIIKIFREILCENLQSFMSKCSIFLRKMVKFRKIS